MVRFGPEKPRAVEAKFRGKFGRHGSSFFLGLIKAGQKLHVVKPDPGQARLWGIWSNLIILKMVGSFFTGLGENSSEFSHFFNFGGFRFLRGAGKMGHFGQKNGHFEHFWAYLFLRIGIRSKNDEVLRNVVFGSRPTKMAQKQHIGNFQI